MNKDLEIFLENPKGSKEQANNLVQYTIIYFDSRKTYNINAQPCTKNDTGGISFVIDFNTSVELAKVTRKSAKTQKMCEEFLKNNSLLLHSSYLNGGLQGLKNAVKQLW